MSNALRYTSLALENAQKMHRYITYSCRKQRETYALQQEQLEKQRKRMEEQRIHMQKQHLSEMLLLHVDTIYARNYRNKRKCNKCRFSLGSIRIPKRDRATCGPA